MLKYEADDDDYEYDHDVMIMNMMMINMMLQKPVDWFLVAWAR